MNELDRLRLADPGIVITSTRAREELLSDLHALQEPRSTRRARRLSAIAASLPLVALGAGAAAATGVMPSPFTDEYDQSLREQPLRGQEGIDPATAKRLSSTAGPAGHAFTVMIARGTGTYVCTMALIEKLPLDRRGPADFEGGGSVCQTATKNAPYGGRFGSSEINPIYARDAVLVRTAAGKAVRADIRTPEGRTIPTIYAEGWFYGWFPNPVDPQATVTLTGYDADGVPVGTEKLTGFRRGDHLR